MYNIMRMTGVPNLNMILFLNRSLFKRTLHRLENQKCRKNINFLLFQLPIEFSQLNGCTAILKPDNAG